MVASPQRGLFIAVLSLGIVTALRSTSLADNPIVQTNYTADPAPFVHNGTLYVYTTHDEDVIVDNFFTMNDWRVYSSTDAVNWTDHGSPLSYTDFSWSNGEAWAAQVTYRDGMFYFYVAVSHSIGVAVSDSPTGPFEDPLGRALVTSDCGDIDPTVFIDDDGQAYLYWGNPDLCYVTLNEDMISYSGSVQHVPMTTESWGVRSDTDRATSYEEGPWFYNREGLYYMVFAAGPISEHIGWATSPGPTGPWTYGGVLMPTEGSSFTNHPGVADYKGKSLFFYHNGALPDGGGYHRSVCVEEFTYGADGSIPQLSMTTEGATAVDVLNPFAQTEAETIAWESGIETEVCSEGGMNVTDISNGDYIKVKEVEFGAGATSFEYRVASGSGGGAIELHLDSENGTLVGTCPVDSTGGDQTWATQSCTVSDATGKHDLFLRFTGGGFKFNWWQFTGPGDPGTGGTGGTSATGGAAGSGGSEPTGGAVDTGGGGGVIVSGGTSATGGEVATGGISNSGGSQAGGTSGTGGVIATGGSTATGGSLQTGGTTTIGATGGNVSTGGAMTATGGISPAGGSMGGGTGTAAGGQIGAGGSTAAGGTLSPGSAGTGGATSSDIDAGSLGTDASSDEGGCGCRVAGGRSNSGSLAAFAALGLLALRSFRRRPRVSRQRRLRTR
jgi:MYXO-CTERM domain-containing protein